MRSISSLIISLAIVFGLAVAIVVATGCSKNTPKPLTPAEAIAAGKAPWDSLPDKAKYASCGDATTAMTAFTTVWNMPSAEEIGADNPMAVDNGRFMEFRMSPDGSGAFAVVQYRTTEKGERVNELAVAMGAAGEQLILDYHIKRALDTGEITGTESEAEIFSLATGEFFCFYP